MAIDQPMCSLHVAPVVVFCIERCPGAMIEESATANASIPVEPSSTVQIQTPVFGDRHIMARGDLRTFVAEIKRFGFSVDDFRLDIKRLPGTQRVAAPAASFAVSVENPRTRRAAVYLGRSSRLFSY